MQKNNPEKQKMVIVLTTKLPFFIKTLKIV